jgi:hypothetical protein
VRNSHIRTIAKQEFTNLNGALKVPKSQIMKGKLDFLELFEKFHVEYKIDFEKELAEYFGDLTLKAGGTISDLESFDENLPPMPMIRANDG